MKVNCEIEESELEGDYGVIASVCARCLRCGHETEPYRTGESSIQGCLVLMREDCPWGETDVYTAHAA
jgi:hypothetical protein